MNLSRLLRNINKLICLTVWLTFFTGCGGDNPTPTPPTPTDDFDLTPLKYPIAPGLVDEASGITPSKNMDGYYWTHQDSGGPNSIYLISGDATSIREFSVPGTVNYDWEDIASGPGPFNGVNYLYIADIGNNNMPVVSENTIYRVQEINNIGAAFEESKVEKIRFRYPDGPRDAESILLDPATKDLYVLSKELTTTNIYRLPYPQSTSDVTTAQFLGAVPGVKFATAADISDDGNEILVRTYLVAYYWKKKAGESILQALTRTSDKTLLIAPEPQGEGICFDNKSRGFLTISERSESSSVFLNYYKRK